MKERKKETKRQDKRKVKHDLPLLLFGSNLRYNNSRGTPGAVGPTGPDAPTGAACAPATNGNTRNAGTVPVAPTPLALPLLPKPPTRLELWPVTL
jgi:hypothetical protein